MSGKMSKEVQSKERQHRRMVGDAGGVASVKGTIIISPKGPADRKPYAKLLKKILQMNGDIVARELPAEHQLITDRWDRCSNYPSLVYMPEKDRLLLSYDNRDQLPPHQINGNNRPILISSDDCGKTWNPAEIKDAHGIPYRLASGACWMLAYFGNGELTMDVEGIESGHLRLFSHDYGETWVSTPIPNNPNGALPEHPENRWDPALADRDPATGKLKRTFYAGYYEAYPVVMGKRFNQAKKIISFPEQWHWRHDPEDMGLTEEWCKEGASDNWPRMMRIDKHWTSQGEPLGIGWYATNFEAPDTNGAPLLIFFGAVDGCCDVFIDGEKIGEQKQPPGIMWNRAFYLPLDKGLSAGKHTMVVRVAKDCNAAGIHKPVWIVDRSSSDACNKSEIAWPFRRAFIRFSYDAGLTFPEKIEPPSWNGTSGVGVNEVALCRADNNDIIAACRIEHPKYGYSKDHDEINTTLDHYCGLGVSLSKDNGYTWTETKVLYEYGRHQPSMALMPNGDVVMTYAVRMGCLQEEHRLVDDDGYPQWSIEAIVSHDNGENWDLDHKYILAKWSGSSQAQSTCTVLLPDGSLLTAFGSGYLSLPIQEAQRQEKYPIGLLPREVCLVRWRPEE